MIIYTTTIKQVHVGNEDVYLEISYDKSAIKICTKNLESEKWFGKVNTTISKDFALQLAKVLIGLAEKF